jgi:hypothetical protein
MTSPKSIKAKVDAFKKAHPVGQCRNTGKYGFDRVCGGLNLSRCIYASERTAEIARSEAANCAASSDER